MRKPLALQTVTPAIVARFDERSMKPRGFSPEIPAELLQPLRHAAEALDSAIRAVVAHCNRASFDAKTGLLNYEAGMTAIAREEARAQRHTRPLSVAMFDGDGFKGVNDTHGHKAGDLVLAALGAHIRRRCRKADFAVRLGGDELLLVLPETSIRGALALANKIRRDVAAGSVSVDGSTIRVTVSGGVACLQDGESVEEVIRRADAAMYHAKSQHNCVEAWRPGLPLGKTTAIREVTEACNA